MKRKLKARLAKAEKGFTLVELIVVIAIIAVLAAILIPTLTAQLQRAQVTSCDTTARKLYDFTNEYITKYVTAGGSYTDAPTHFTVDLSTTTDPDIFDDSDAKEKVGGFVENLKGDFNLKDTSKAVIFIDKYGKAYAALYTESGYTISGNEFSKPDDTVTTNIAWKDGKHEGVTTDGYVVGTYPKVEFKAST